MCTNLLQDSRTFEFLQEIDRDTVTQAGHGMCRFCGDRLHRAYYMRKPRAPGIGLSAEFCMRPSFCCQRDGCRRRMTPALVRFLGRRVYVSIIVLLVASMTQGPTPKRLCALKAELGISSQTLKRWLHYWREIFASQSTWRYHRGNFMPPIADMELPLALLARFEQTSGNIISAAIKLLRLANNCSLDPHPQRTQ